MTSERISRRTIARGVAWSVPTLIATTAAPALALSCGDIKAGQPLPTSAFLVDYLNITNETFGGVSDMSITLEAGLRINPLVQSCVSGAGLTLSQGSSSSRLTRSNRTTYTVTGGTESAGTGTAGAVRNGCTSAGDGLAQVCITITGFSVNNSTGTNSTNPTGMAFSQNIAVAGFGTTAIFLNATSFTKSGTKWVGGGLSVTSS